MPTIVISGPERIADRYGTHEPGDEIDDPSQELLELAERGKRGEALHPDTGKPYVTLRKEPAAQAAPTSEKETG